MVLSKILTAGEGRRIKQLRGVVETVNARSDDAAALSDDGLRTRSDELRAQAVDGADLDDLLPEAFALVRETATRVLGQRPYDVQILGGAAMHAGEIAEMRTGEGKTLTATLPVYLNALTGKGVHVVTANPYLASRDAEWMGRIYRHLGLEVGLVYPNQPRAEKRPAYAADITHGTNNEFGFDFLRDHMVLKLTDKSQRGHNFAIVDEVDSILIDEARTPLIISGPADQATEWYQVFARRVAPRLTRDTHYEVDEAKRTISVTEDGVAKVEQLLGVDNLYESVNTPLIHHLNNSIRAKELYKRDVEYIVEGGEVHIVDENTGRTLYGRRYSEGLHQCIEAKEGVTVKAENQTLATITLQNYFRTYDKLAGMTGTAKTEEAEFGHIYTMGVVQVPTHRDPQRSDGGDLIYKSVEAKLNAVADDIAERHAEGQPVLVGTVSVEKSEVLGEVLRRRGIPHEVLNAKNHFKEAEIIAQAGRLGAVTVATNMAGRGVDIQLGGNAEALAAADVRTQLAAREDLDHEGDPDGWQATYDAALPAALEAAKAQVAKEGDEVRALGGLYVLGTERHDSRRIDNQLRGRSGRQGDPGATRFYLSLGDDLMQRFNAQRIESIMTRFKLPDDLPIEAKVVTKAVERSQAQVESQNFERRKNVLKYDDVLNQQRKVIYAQRNIVLEGEPDAVSEIAEDFVESALTTLVELYTTEAFGEEWDLDELFAELEKIYPISLDKAAFVAKARAEELEAAELVESVVDDAFSRYEEREDDIGEEMMRRVERRVILSVVDRLWREHLYEMDQLRDGIGLRAVGQRDPLVEYQREAYNAFEDLLKRIREEATGYFFNLPVKKPDEQQAADGGEAAATKPAAVARPALNDAPSQPTPSRLSYSGGGEEGSASYTVRDSGSGGAATATAPRAAATPEQVARRAAGADQVSSAAKVGRNAPCPCGSGLKFKKCCGA